MIDENTQKTKSGFTIVELLIVIVVIAVLAAITIVAYNGIQTRAENTKTFNAISAYARAMTAYAADGSVYPTPTTTFTCLGNVTMCGNVTVSSNGCDSYGRASASAPLNTVLSSITTSLPEPSTQVMNCGGNNFSGVWYNYTNAGKNGALHAYLKGSLDCQSIGGLSAPSRFQLDDTTRCRYTLPALP